MKLCSWKFAVDTGHRPCLQYYYYYLCTNSIWISIHFPAFVHRFAHAHESLFFFLLLLLSSCPSGGTLMCENDCKWYVTRCRPLPVMCKGTKVTVNNTNNIISLSGLVVGGLDILVVSHHEDIFIIIIFLRRRCCPSHPQWQYYMYT